MNYRAVYQKIRNRFTRLNPPQLITLSFLVMILTGAVLLNLPVSSQSGESIGFIDALFTATSANCVTGLIVVNTMEHWTLFGKVVILLLIQAGALGLVTILTISMIVLGRRISLKDRLVIQASFNQDSPGGMVRLIRRIVLTTLAAEGIGAVVLTAFFFFHEKLNIFTALWYGIFHSVSAFCNAGFDILGSDSLTPWQGNLWLTLPVMMLIISGGLGFTVWTDLFHGLKNLYRQKFPGKKLWTHLHLHTKIVLTATVLLLFTGMSCFLILEWNNPDTLGQMSLLHKAEAALFQSVTLRTAGFNSIPQNSLGEGSLFLSCLFMMIGGSPGSTAGGMKTVTIAVILIAVISALKGRKQIEVYGRSLPLHILQKALTVYFTVLMVVLLSAFLLYFTEQNNGFGHSFLDLLFECSSAAGTVGISTGITPHLTTAGRIIIIICMFLGRLSPVTVVVALNMKRHSGSDRLNRPEAKVIIG